MGDGAEASATEGSVVRISYVASILGSGKRIGSTQRFTFVLGRSNLIFWEEAIEGMRVGGSRRLLVPPSAKLGLRDQKQRDLVPEGETVRFDCELQGIESGLSAAAYNSGLVGGGIGGRRLRSIILLLSLIPYLLPESSRPALWQSGSTSEILREQGLIAEVRDSEPPSPLQQQRIMSDERSADAALFGTNVESALYGR